MTTWKTVALGDATTILGGGTPARNNPEFYGGNIPWVTPKDMKSWEISGTQVTITQSGVENSATRVVPPNSVLVVVRSGVLKHTLPVALNRVPVAINQDMKALQCSEDLYPDFLARFIKARSPEILHWVRATTADNFPIDLLRNLPISFPTLGEQRRIAAILDQSDALRAKRRSALTQLNNLAEGVFLDLFGDPKLNDKKWPTNRIGSLVSKFHGGASLEPEDFVDSGFPILHKGAIKPNGLITLDLKKKTFASAAYAAANRKCQVDRRFLAVTLRDLVPTGPSIGLAVDLRCGPFDEYLLAQGAYGFILKPEIAVPEYFVQLSNMPTYRHILRKNSVGSTQIHIRTPVYLDIQIPVPPIELQREFASQVAVMQRAKIAQQESLVGMDELFDSVQERAFSGALLKE